jgi:hypothetical protein
MEKENKNNAAEATQQTEEAAAQAATAAAAQDGTEGAPAGEGGEPAAEAATEPKPRDLFYERIRTNIPEGKYDEDEDEYYRNALTAMDAYEKDSKTLKDLTEKLNKRLGADPQEAEVMLDWLDGVDIRTAITRHMGAEALSTPEEGSEEYEAWSKAGEARRKELADMEAKVNEYRTNAEASAADLDALATENGWSDEEKAGVEEFVKGILEKVYSGRLDKDFYNLIQHGRNYEADIEGAREQGRVDGRNEKIEVEKKHLAGSGLPNGGVGGNASEEVDAPKGNKTADWLAGMTKRRV